LTTLEFFKKKACDLSPDKKTGLLEVLKIIEQRVEERLKLVG